MKLPPGERSGEPLESRVVEELRAIVGEDGVRTSPESRLAFECDALTVAKGRADVILMPRSCEEVAPVVGVLAREGVAFTARGSGTGLTGGAIPVQGGAVIVMSRLKRILEMNPADGYAVVEPGVVNLSITKEAQKHGFCYAPDPASQHVCTIGGNVAFNAGGPHTLVSGVTTNHVLGLEVVLPDGETVTLGGPCEDAPGLDLRGLMIGSEGTLGIVTKVFVRLVRIQPAWRTILAVFPTFESATRGVSAVISAGIVPAALELMDRTIIGVVEDAFRLGLPREAGAMLIIELNGAEEGLDRVGESVAAICRGEGASDVSLARDDAERAALWAGRKRAAGAIGRISPSYLTQDVVIPRHRLPEMAREIEALEKKHGLRIGNLLHAGDGNMHPWIMFDERDPEQVERSSVVSREIVHRVIEFGGSVTGEHGIGIEKIEFMDKQFGREDLDLMRRLKDLFDPAHMCNPGKVLPS